MKSGIVTHFAKVACFSLSRHNNSAQQARRAARKAKGKNG